MHMIPKEKRKNTSFYTKCEFNDTFFSSILHQFLLKLSCHKIRLKMNHGKKKNHHKKHHTIIELMDSETKKCIRIIYPTIPLEF